MIAMRHVVETIVGSLLALSLGCGGHGPRTVSNPDLEAKIPAIKDSVRADDRSAIPELVNGLKSDDSAVRFYSIRGLHALTGRTLGYRYYDSEDARAAALLRWEQWVTEQKSK